MNASTFRPARLLGFAAIGVLLAACYTSPSPRVEYATTLRLPELVGEKVEMSGELYGPAKLGDYINVAGQAVYLPGARKPAGEVPYGSRVTVAGRLGRDEGVVSDCTAGAADCVASIPPHYYIRDAEVRPER